MSLYEVQRLMRELNVSRALLERFHREREAVLDAYGLDEHERAAIAAGDVGALWRMGAHPQIVLAYSRLLGVARDELRRQLEPLAGTRQLRSDK